MISRTPLLIALLAGAVLASPAAARTWVVSQKHPAASDKGPGTERAPFRTISRAAEAAQPGDTVLVHAGIYRERVAPARGGEPGKPIVYAAAEGQDVHIRGSEVWKPRWKAVNGHSGVYAGELDEALFRTGAPEGALQTYNPYAIRLQNRTDCTLGQVFVDGEPLREATSREHLLSAPGSWLAEDGKRVLVHFGRPTPDPARRVVELTTRGRIFAPYVRGLAHITVRGFIMSHCANNHHAGFYNRGSRFPQAGALSTRGGNHWTIENNVIQWAKATAIDCGYEGRHDLDEYNKGANRGCGYHQIQGNHIQDNGGAGIVGLRTPRTRIVGNTIERNNRLGLDGAETSAIKLHSFTDGLIEGNLIRGNDMSGIWLDNVFRNSRITRNVILDNTGAGVFIEMGDGPLLVDNNVIALTTIGRSLAGDGVYSHDASRVTLAHNLIFGNANFGVWGHVGTDRNGGRLACSHWRVLNNMILANHRGAISLPAESPRSRDNVSDRNLLTSAYNIVTSETYALDLDRPLFLLNTNKGRVPARQLKDAYFGTFDGAAAPRVDLNAWAGNPLLTLDQWRKMSGNDGHSAVPAVLRPQLDRYRLTLSFVIDESPGTLGCKPVEGVSRDLFGREIPKEDILPGPFQRLKTEPALADRSRELIYRGPFSHVGMDNANELRLWPLPTARTALNQGAGN